MLNTSFSPWPNFTKEEADAVSNVLLSNRVNSWTGEQCHLFEKDFASFTGSKYAIALANGTVALELCLFGLGIGTGDEVITTCRTFIASASAIVMRGATPVLADVDRASQNITAETIRPLITSKTRAIIVVHLAGWPCEMDSIMDLADEHGIKVIEDCAQAHGATYMGRSVGSLGHVAAWSFCQDKIMTTGGEGGMVTTDDRELWLRMWSYKDHGKNWDTIFLQTHKPGFRWLHDKFGTNWRMLEMQAVIGRIQLTRMKEWTSLRRKNCIAIWSEAKKCCGFRVPEVAEHIGHAGYKCYVFVNNDMLKKGWNRDRIMQKINDFNVPCYTGSCSEIYLEKCFRDSGYAPKSRLPVAMELGETSLMFLVHPTLSDNEIQKTCDAINEIAKEAFICKSST